jgi:hypothetical protein
VWPARDLATNCNHTLGALRGAPVVVVESADYRDALHTPYEFRRTRDRLVLGESLVRTGFVVEADELGDEMAEVRLVEDEDVVEQLPTQGRHSTRNPARCQRRMVAGCTSNRASRHAGATRTATAIAKRCHGDHRTRPTILRCATMSCCRSSAFSATSPARDRSRSAANRSTNDRALVMAAS